VATCGVDKYSVATCGVDKENKVTVTLRTLMPSQWSVNMKTL